jgi:hypothetical protein
LTQIHLQTSQPAIFPALQGSSVFQARIKAPLFTPPAYVTKENRPQEAQNRQDNPAHHEGQPLTPLQIQAIAKHPEAAKDKDVPDVYVFYDGFKAFYCGKYTQKTPPFLE